MRKTAWITAVAAATVLLVGGCSSSSDDGGSGNESSAPNNGGEQDNQGGGSPEGIWRSGDGANMNVLNIEGTQANLAGGGALCNGSVTDSAIDMTCSSGGSERSKGSFTVSEDGQSLTVTWEGAGEETYTKSEVPTDLPTGDLPTELPTDLPTDIEMPEMPDAEMPEMPEMPG